MVIRGHWRVCGLVRSTPRTAGGTNEAAQFYLFAAPWIVGFVVFTFGAVLASLVISFCKWDTLSPAHVVGLRNYADLFTADSRFYKALGVTFYYAGLQHTAGDSRRAPGCGAANQKVFGIRLFRTVYYLPVVISGVATSVLWQYISTRPTAS